MVEGIKRINMGVCWKDLRGSIFLPFFQRARPHVRTEGRVQNSCFVVEVVLH